MKLSDTLKKYSKPHPLFGEPRDPNLEGFFHIPYKNFTLIVLASTSQEWEHVSVSILKQNRCPNWEEMSYVKNLCFDENETVVQFHPKKTEYINNHPYCLHLWKKLNHEYELPASIEVGIKGLTCKG